MRNNINILLLVSIVTLILQSCASFDETLLNSNPLNEENLSELNGRYKIVAKNDSLYFSNRQIWMYNNFLNEIDRKVVFNVPKLDSTKTYHFQIKILDDKKLIIDFYNENNVVRNETLKYRLKDDGYLYLKNKNVQPIFIPYIAGALDVSKTRLTLDNNKNLIFDSTNHRSGGIAIVIFGGGSSWDYRKEYERIKNE